MQLPSDLGHHTSTAGNRKWPLACSCIYCRMQEDHRRTSALPSCRSRGHGHPSGVKFKSQSQKLRCKKNTHIIVPANVDHRKLRTGSRIILKCNKFLGCDKWGRWFNDGVSIPPATKHCGRFFNWRSILESVDLVGSWKEAWKISSLHLKE